MIERAFILAAGFGTRMGELTKDTPKPLLPVAGRPLIDYTLFYLREWGIREIVVNLHYHASKLERHLKDYPYAKVRISHEPNILGTAGGLRKGMDLFSASDAPFLLTNPDTILLPEQEAGMDRPFNPISSFHLSGEGEFDAGLFLMEKPELSRETGFFFTGGDTFPEGSQEGSWSHSRAEARDSFSPAPTGGWGKIRMRREGGSHYYIGLSIINPASIADLSPELPAELGPRWNDSSEKGRLYGRVWKGSVLDAGRRDSYEALRDRIQIPDFLLESWGEFCNGWPSQPGH